VLGQDFKQIAQKAHALGMVDAAHYDEALSEYRWLAREIQAAVILPEKR